MVSAPYSEMLEIGGTPVVQNKDQLIARIHVRGPRRTTALIISVGQAYKASAAGAELWWESEE